VIGSAIPRIGSSNALGYDTSTRRRLSRLDHLVKRFPHLLTGYRRCDFRPLLCLVWPVSYPLTLPKGGLYSRCAGCHSGKYGGTPYVLSNRSHQVRRLTFALRQGKIHLISDQQVDMTLPAKPAPTPGADVPFWYELRDSTAGVLQRLPARDPIPLDSEVFSDDPKRSIARAEVVPPEVVFTMVIPDLEAVEEIRLMRAAPPSDPEAKTRAAQPGPIELGRFKLGTKG
jgi:hypothetical protein